MLDFKNTFLRNEWIGNGGLDCKPPALRLKNTTLRKFSDNHQEKFDIKSDKRGGTVLRNRGPR